MLIKMIIAFATACFAVLFFGGFLDAEPTEIVKKILFGGASAIMILLAIGIIFVDKQPKNRRIDMAIRTERVMEWFLTFGFFGAAIINAYLAYKLFLAERFLSGFGIMGAMLIAILFGVFYLHEILVRRFAERKEV